MTTYALITPDGKLEFRRGVPSAMWRDADPHYGAHSGFQIRDTGRGRNGLRGYVGDVAALNREKYPPNEPACLLIAALGGPAVPQFGNVTICGQEIIDPEIGETDLCGLTAAQQREITELFGKATGAGGQQPGREEHEHEGFDIPQDYSDPAGRTVDYKLLSSLIGTAFDACTSCQDPLLTLLVEDAATCARLVELACVSVHSALGGLPASMLEDGVPGPAAPEFRRLARLGADGANALMFSEAEMMSTAERREAANTALDLLIAAITGLMGPL